MELLSRAALALPLAAAGCLFDGDLKIRGPVVPEVLSDGWSIATPEEVGLDPAALAQVHEELLREDAHFGTRSFLVVKGGKLVFETYLRSVEDRDRYNHLQSATKSITSLAVGLARDHGALRDLATPISEIFPEEMPGLDAAKPTIEVADLLTMRSGLDFDNDHFAYEMTVGKPADPLRYILEKPMYDAPGARFFYRDADPQLVAYAIERTAKTSERALVEEHLFAPLGIRRWYWGTNPDGVTLGAYGLHLLPRDLAKIGQLLLDGGTWRGERVISEAWIREATTSRVETAHVTSTGQAIGYGYFFWIVPGVGFAAAGHGGQFALVVPEKDLVLVQTAAPDTDDLHGSAIEDFLALTAPLR